MPPRRHVPTRHRPRPRQQRLRRLLAALPPLSLGHLLIAVLVAGVALAVVFRMGRAAEWPEGPRFVVAFSTATVVLAELGFWLAFGPSLRRHLTPSRDRGTGADGIRWLDEPDRDAGEITWKD